MSVVEKVDGRPEALLERLEKAIQELAAKPVVVHVHIPGMGCEREAIMRLLVKLERDLASGLERCPEECRRRALERVQIYKLELEELLYEEPVFGK